ncbi:MAG: ABC transporter substrate-binding protein [Lactobacillus sp.]|jgi:ABC-type amino acid transport substrate-binding protein|nr:ABC transporter substrate-binding protein [Lactobacillus sp.]
MKRWQLIIAGFGLALVLLFQTQNTALVQAADTSWSSVKSSKTLTIGLTGDYAPWQTTAASGKLGGYDVAVAKLVAKDLGVKAKFTPGQFAGLIPALNNGKFDVLFGALQATPERKKQLLLSKPYAADGTVAVVKKSNNTIKSLTDIKGKVVGAGTGSSFAADVQAIGGFKDLKEYKAPVDAFKDLKLGRIDVVSIGIVSAKHYIKTAPDGKDFKLAGKPYRSYDIDVALKKGNNALASKINAAIEKEQKNGQLTKLQKQYLQVTSQDLK